MSYIKINCCTSRTGSNIALVVEGHLRKNPPPRKVHIYHITTAAAVTETPANNIDLVFAVGVAAVHLCPRRLAVLAIALCVSPGGLGKHRPCSGGTVGDPSRAASAPSTCSLGYRVVKGVQPTRVDRLYSGHTARWFYCDALCHCLWRHRLQ